MGISPGQYQNKDNGKKDKPKTAIMGFDDVAGSSGTPSTEKEEVKETPAKEKKQKSASSTKTKETPNKKDTPTNEEPKEPVVVETETPVTEVQEQEEVTGDSDVEEKETVESTENDDLKDDESGNNKDNNEGESTPNSSGNNDEGEKEMTQEGKGGQDPNGNKTEEKDAVLSWLEEELKANKKVTKTYFLDKEVVDKIDKIGKKIPKAKGGTGGFVNELLKQALKDRNLW